METLHQTDVLLLTGAVLVLLGIASSLIARRFGAPLLLVFLGLGIALGPEGPGGFVVEHSTTYLIGAFALAIILFDGGLRTRLRHVRSALLPSAILATVGVLVTAGITGVAAKWLFDLSWLECWLLGAIVASTDAAAVFFLLRAGGLQLPQRVSATLEVESGSNDPMAVFLTVLLCTWIESTSAASGSLLLVQLGMQVGFGVAIGLLGGMAVTKALNRLALPEGIHPLLALAGAIAVFALCNLIGGSGFLAVYLAGLVVGNRPVRAIANVTAVQDAATWLAQGVMFIVLGLLVVPSKLLALLWPALAIAAVLMFLARPLSVILCLSPFGYRRAEIAFIGWVGLRGAVGIFLASIPILLALPQAELYFNVAFVAVIVSLTIQGWTLAPSARLLGVALPRKEIATRRIELDLPGQLALEMVGYHVADGSAILQRDVAIPGWARQAMVVREEAVLLPDQAGSLRAGDTAYFLAPPGDVYRLDWLFAEGAEARAAEKEMFGAFSLPGDVPLGELASFYGLPIPERYGQRSAAELFAQRFDNAPQIGDRLQLGNALLVVRRIDDEKVVQIGIKFGGVSAQLFGADSGASSSASFLQRSLSRLMDSFRR